MLSWNIQELMEMIQVFFSKVLNNAAKTLTWLCLSRLRICQPQLSQSLMKVESKTESWIPGVTKSGGANQQNKTLDFLQMQLETGTQTLQEVSNPQALFCWLFFKQRIYCRHCYVDESTPESLQFKPERWSMNWIQVSICLTALEAIGRPWRMIFANLPEHSRNPVEVVLH